VREWGALVDQWLRMKNPQVLRGTGIELCKVQSHPPMVLAYGRIVTYFSLNPERVLRNNFTQNSHL
jgi:hypothetical protein